MNDYSVILKKIRTNKKITIKQAANLTGRGAGWISEIENGKARAVIDHTEFKRIVKCYDAEDELKRFQLWANNQKRNPAKTVWYEGAIYKHLRLKKELSLVDAAKLIGISKSQLSNIESSTRKAKPEIRTKILEAYGHKQASFQNYIKKKERVQSIPVELRLKLLLKKFETESLEKVFKYAHTLLATGA